MAKVILEGFIVVPVADLEAVTGALVTHKKLTLEEAGCLVFTVTPDAVDPCRFHVYEVFVDQEAFDHHQARVQSSPWGAVTKHVERHYRIRREKA